MSERRERACQSCRRAFMAGPYARLGPCCRWKARHRPAKYVWTPERDQVLRARYDSRVRGRSRAIAASFGFPVWVVKRRARELGIVAQRAGWQPWTPEQIDFLEEHAGTRHVNWIARQLGRTLTSVVMRLKHQRISRRVRDGYTMTELQEALGLDHRRIEQLVDEGKLRARQRGEVHQTRWIFRDGDVLDFIRRHPTAFRLDRVDQLWFLDLVFRGRIGETARKEAA